MNLGEAIRALKSQASSARAMLESCLDAARDPAGEGERVFTELFTDESLHAAGAADERVRTGAAVRTLEGVPISIKDLFDVRGSVTRAASLSMPEAVPAAADAAAIERLRKAGAIIVGKTNMTEFAYSGVGINPHFRYAAESVRSGRQTHTGGIIVGCGGFGERRDGGRRARYRHRGIDPNSSGTVRIGWMEADGSARLPERRSASLHLTRHGRPDRG